MKKLIAIFLFLFGFSGIPIGFSQEFVPRAIIGKWISEEDQKLIWEFSNPFLFQSEYEGQNESSSGVFNILDWENTCSEYKETDLKDQKYLQIKDEEGFVFCYYLETLNHEQLTLIYMPRGNILSFRKLKPDQNSAIMF
ncbi:hypothetical protein SAMN04488519_105303 [Algoriphagus ornithinivorans]|uniref:Lipocalin-like domain-containing protein n=1 Tax=Algoriphagus ornithinivorans TaxID=226506 RepID=A0A1I5GBS7_9BACT|nr:hypothetical protein [Algoriphagus ornithinivorans]SFO33424.1 hypothetical protein SAMN04488519_105303 [Algoriphagus ornithinivorans]